MELTNSKRLLYTANYVTTQLTPKDQRKVEAKPGGGYHKANVLRSLDLKPHDLDRIEIVLNEERQPQYRSEMRALLEIALRMTNPDNPISMMDLAATLAPLSYDAFTHFVERSASVKEISIGTQILLFSIEQRRKISPVGRIHLERIEMYPAGVQKGELVFTVPMAPGETVTISHKEWSTSSREFEEIVQDSFESYSEQGVAEKTDASMSAENEAKHTNSINFGASLSGSYGNVSLTTTLGLAATKDERQSVKQSLQKNREVTEKASARTRKEHKVSMKLETKMGTEDHSGKTITNTASTPIRIDYYRMMRKWRTDLFRYGLRQTYDITIPLPGVRLWALHQRIVELEKKLRTPLSFPLKPEDIHSWNYRAEEIKWGATVQASPADRIDDQKQGRIEWLDEGAADISRFNQIDIDVPAGYYVDVNAKIRADLSLWPNPSHTFNVIGGIHDPLAWDPITSTHVVKGELPIIYGKSGHLAVVYAHRFVSMGSIVINLTYRLDKAARENWQYAAWSQLRAAAEARHQEEMARLQYERDRLWRLLNGKDTLSLRRLEREELIRLVMQWLLGPEFAVVSAQDDNKPPNLVQEIMSRLLNNESNHLKPLSEPPTAPPAAPPVDPLPPTFSPTFSGVSEAAWFQALDFGEFVKFIHQAVEWENILYFLYPYFWGSETLGRDKLLFEHNDPEHERFLRAGYARIVLPVRPGFEEAFTRLIETGKISKHLPTPYVPIAKEIADFARTNYAGIPPANPELHARPLLYPEQRATWDAMQVAMEYIDAFKVKHGRYPAKLADLPSGLPVDAAGNPIVVPVDAWGNPFVYKAPGLGADYDLVSLGADNQKGGEGLEADISSAAGASLVATWFDYTPTSALDIEVDTKPGDIA